MDKTGMVKLLREDPAFADAYLASALENVDRDGGFDALLAALRHVAEAEGMYYVSQRVGISREGLHRALSPGGNPTVQILLAVLHAAGLKLGIRRVSA